jgi:hypothetical protein
LQIQVGADFFFEMLEYKAEWYGREIISVDRFALILIKFLKKIEGFI